MVWVDLVALGVLGYFVIEGAKIGFVGYLFRYIAIILGLILGFSFYDLLGIELKELFGIETSPKFAPYIWGTVIFLIVTFFVHLISLGIRKIIQIPPLGTIDRLLGGGLGFIKTMGLTILFIFLLENLNLRVIQSLNNNQSIKSTVTYKAGKYLLLHAKDLTKNYKIKTITPSNAKERF